MRQDLFRQEALAFNRERLLGDILVNRPVSLSLFTTVSVVLVLVLISFVYWGQYTRKAHVSGYLAPTKGADQGNRVQTGTSIEKHVKEGQHVRRRCAVTLSTERSSPTTAEPSRGDSGIAAPASESAAGTGK
jgi:membrane fusion protein